MKEVKAFIKPVKLPEVTHILHHLDGITGVSIVKVQDLGWRKSKDLPFRGDEDDIEEIPHIKVEVICEDYITEEVITTIEKSAHTGERGDGIIYVSNIEKLIQIKTGKTF
ncbi:MAG: P-II family nitrogen regulator [SAR324 cluster bacterium]|nr:P-II family nitrogen regulator [SAR324 cluster bacterium]